MEDLLKRAYEGNLTLSEIRTLIGLGEIDIEDAETLAGILLNC